MAVFLIRLAGLTVEMHSTYPYAKEFCKDFLIENAVPDFSVAVSEEEVAKELAQSPESAASDYAEIICLYRKIADRLPEYNRFVFHGAAISYNENGYLFTAPSGTGKTTHITLWRRALGSQVGIINGDKPILQLCEDGVIVHSTPWAGKEGWYRNLSLPLKAVCIIEQATTNKTEKILPQSALMCLLRQIYMPTDPQAAQGTLSLFERFCATADFYRCRCNISVDAVKSSFEAMTGERFDERKEYED